MLLLLTSTGIDNISLEEEILCLSMSTLNRVRKKGYQKVTLVKLPLDKKEALENYNDEFLQWIENMCASYADVLNGYHAVQFSVKSWRYMIGLWCYYLLCVCLDRYYRLKHIEACYPGIPIIGAELLGSHSMIPNTMEELTAFLKDENYNAAIFTKIAKQLSLNIINTIPVALLDPLKKTQKEGGKSFRRYLKNKITFLCYKIMLRRANVILVNSYFSKRMLMKLFMCSFGRISFLPKYKLPNLEATYVRDILSVNLLTGNPDIDKVMKSMAPLLFPRLLFEGFKSYNKDVKKLYTDKASVLFTANGWIENSQFNLLAANFHDSGKQVWGAPHGGAGSFLTEHYRYTHHEIKLSDRYFVPGSFYEKYCSYAEKRTIPIIFYLKESIQKNKKKIKETHFLYGLTSFPAYTNNFDFFSENYIDYINFVKRFFLALDPGFERKLLVRTHREDEAWELNNTIRLINEKVKFDSWERAFHQSLLESSLYICDHISTTYMQALFANKPMVLFFDIKQARIRPDALPLLLELKKVGMFHETPESAVEHIKNIQKNVENWWFSKDVQDAKNIFAENFAYASKRPFNEWLNVLKV